MKDIQSISRRSLLEGAAGAAGLITLLNPALRAQTSPARIRETFDFDWKFFKGDAAGAQQPEFNDSAWRSVDLPHDWSIEGPFGENEPTGAPGGYLPTGVGWYRKRFRLPESYGDRQVFVEFDGVYENSEVWINGQYLGKRPYGYSSFSYDLKPHLNFGARDNLIAVRADNSHQPNSRWYTGSGIYRHTWLVITGRVHVAQWGTYFAVSQMTGDFAMVRVRTRLVNDGKTHSNCTLVTTLLDGDGKVIQTAEGKQDLDAGSDLEVVQQIAVRNFTPWSLENPYLYKVRSVVQEQDRVMDEYETPAGIRHRRLRCRAGIPVERPARQAEWRLPAPRSGIGGGGRAGACMGTAPEHLERDGLQRHSDLAQSSRARISGPVRPDGFPGDGRIRRRVESLQARGPLCLQPPLRRVGRA